MSLEPKTPMTRESEMLYNGETDAIVRKFFPKGRTKKFHTKYIEIKNAFEWFVKHCNIFGEHAEEFVTWGMDDLTMRYLNGDYHYDPIIYGLDYEHEITPILKRFLVYKNLPTAFETYYKIQIRFEFEHRVRIEYRIGDNYTTSFAKANDLKAWVKPYAGDVDFISKDWKMEYNFFCMKKLNKKYSTEWLNEIKKEIKDCPNELTLRCKWAKLKRS